MSENERPERESPVSLREVTAETVRSIVALKVLPEQEQFVAPNGLSISQAYFQREQAWFRAIYAGDTPVGFLMLYDDPEEPEYFLWRFMIDARYQGLGFGKRALDLLVAYVRTRPGATALGTSCVPKPGGPCPFYERYGFKYTGEEDDGELVMRLEL
jgi:diamine N-acetyltransferase